MIVDVTNQAYMSFSISFGTFLSASDDKSGTLDEIEEKIARATMLPRSHGEVLFSVELNLSL